jgi:hypothetical protein
MLHVERRRFKSLFDSDHIVQLQGLRARFVAKEELVHVFLREKIPAHGRAPIPLPDGIHLNGTLAHKRQLSEAGPRASS